MTVVNLGNGVMDVISRGADARLARARVTALEQEIKIKQGRNKMELARIMLDARRVEVEEQQSTSTIALRQTEIDIADMLIEGGMTEAQIDAIRARSGLARAQSQDVPVRSELISRGLEDQETRTGIDQQRADDTRDFRAGQLGLEEERLEEGTRRFDASLGLDQQRIDDVRDARQDQVGLGESQLGENARQFNVDQDLSERQFKLTERQLSTAGALQLIQSGVPSLVDNVKNSVPTLEESRTRVETYIPELKRLGAPTEPADMEIWAQADFAAVSKMFVENRRLDKEFDQMVGFQNQQSRARGFAAAPVVEREESRALRERKNSIAEALDTANLHRSTLTGEDTPQAERDASDENINRLRRDQSRNNIDIAKLLRKQERRAETFNLRGPTQATIGAPGAISDLGRIVGRQVFNGEQYDMIRAANGGVFPLVNSLEQRNNLGPNKDYIMITRDGKVIQRTTPGRKQ